MRLRIEHKPNPEPSEVGQLNAALSNFNRTRIPEKGYAPIYLVLLSDETEGFAGGLNGFLSYGWLFIETIWVAEPARSQGWGSKLMAAAEEEARRQGCRHAWLDTFSFQARAFYEKLGYQVFGELEDFPPGHSRYFLRKNL